MSHDAVPEPVNPQTTTGVFQISDTTKEKIAGWLRIAILVLLATLLAADIAMYSSHQALLSRVESQEQRFERLDTMMMDALSVSQNAAKVESMTTKMEEIEKQLMELSIHLKRDMEEEAEREKASQKKKKN